VRKVLFFFDGPPISELASLSGMFPCFSHLSLTGSLVDGYG